MDSLPSRNIDPALWEHYYEVAISERTDIRLQRIAEAQAPILERAEALEQGKGCNAECQALEDAADFLQNLKLNSLGDGVGKEVEEGDVEPIAEKPDSPHPIVKTRRLS